MIWSWQVPHPNSDDLRLSELLGERADRVLESLHPDCSRSQLSRLIKEGRVTENGNPIKASNRLKRGATIQIDFPEPKSLDLISPSSKPTRTLEIFFEDSDILVLNKPAGLTVHPSATQTEDTLVHDLLHYVKDLSGIGGVLRPGIVHRIDKDTSGVMVITKTDAAHRKLSEMFSRHAIERRYWALCYGEPKLKEGRVESLIGRNPKDRKKMSMQVKTGKTAITKYKVLEVFTTNRGGGKPFASLLEATLETGRTHQVRVHCTGLGCSLLGDPVYGTPTNTQAKWLALPEQVRKAVLKLPGQALHARILGFVHPITGEPLRFEAPMPAEFSELLDELKKFFIISS